jgi:hypothetical protein
MRATTYGLGLSLLLAAPSALAKKPSPKAHEHGIANLSIAIEGQKALVALEAPGDGIFGFESAPKTEKQKKTVAEAMKTLREQGTELFVFPKELDCKVSEVDVETSQDTEIKEAAPKPPEKALPVKKGDAAKDAAKDAKKGAHDDEHEAEHKGEHEGEHADVHADYTFTCAKPLSGQTVQLGLLKLFPRVKKVKVQVLSDTAQSGVTVQSEKDVVKL